MQGSILEGNSVVDGTVVRVVWRLFYLKKKSAMKNKLEEIG